MMNRKKIHFNIPQLYSSFMDAPEEWGIMGRALGKTTNILAPKISKRLNTMPRCNRVLVAATFQQILTRTLPPLVEGFERLGYKEGYHFLVGQKPPERWKRMWKWDGPYQRPYKYEYVISWWNGSVIQMVSQDRIGSTNGMSIDGIDGDEAKLLNQERLEEETMLANRGLKLAFANDPHHHGMTFTTDMPVGTAGRWILDKEKNMDAKQVAEVAQLQAAWMKEKNAGRKAKIETALRLAKRKMVLFHEASTLENIHALGIDYIRQMMRNIPDNTFRTSVLNRRPNAVEDGFYPDLDEEKHGYFAYEYSSFHNKLGYDFEALKAQGAEVDADYDTNKPIHVCVDNNRKLTPMVAGQVNKKLRELRTINCFYSEYPEQIHHTVQKFKDYYKNHKRKTVYFWFDHTLIQEFGHTGSAADAVIHAFRYDRDWVVVERYIGQALGHSVRYNMYGRLLKEDGYYPWVLRINRERCAVLLTSMYLTGAVLKKDGFAKDKSTELDPKFPAIEAPHFGEALDMWVSGVCETDLEVEGDDAGSSVGLGIDIL